MTVEQVYKQCLNIIGKASDTPSLDARIIIQDVLNFDSSAFILKSHDSIAADNENMILEMAQKRAKNMPVAYIVGHRGFFEDDFIVNQDTLIPRADTEILVETALNVVANNVVANNFATNQTATNYFATNHVVANQTVANDDSIKNCSKPHHCANMSRTAKPDELKTQKLKILDLCCGTGCIGISVAKVTKRDNPSLDIELTLADISNGALQVCQNNAIKILSSTKISWHVVQTDLFENLKNMKFDLILTNPPYIKSNIVPTLEAQVQQEPKLALDGGQDGLNIIRKIVAQAPSFMENNGHLIMEIGFDEKDDVKEMFSNAGFVYIDAKKDLGNRDRVVFGKWNKGCKGVV